MQAIVTCTRRTSLGLALRDPRRDTVVAPIGAGGLDPILVHQELDGRDLLGLPSEPNH